MYKIAFPVLLSCSNFAGDPEVKPQDRMQNVNMMLQLEVPLIAHNTLEAFHLRSSLMLCETGHRAPQPLYYHWRWSFPIGRKAATRAT